MRLEESAYNLLITKLQLSYFLKCPLYGSFFIVLIYFLATIQKTPIKGELLISFLMIYL